MFLLKNVLLKNVLLKKCFVHIVSYIENKKSNKLAFFVIDDPILSLTLKGKSLSIWKSMCNLFYFNILVIFL